MSYIPAEKMWQLIFSPLKAQLLMLMTVMPMMSTMKITEKMFRVGLFWVLEEIGFLR